MNTALLLVDIQNDYFPGGRMELAGSQAAAANAARLLAFFREKRWPLIHVRHVAASDRAPFFRPGTAGAEIHPSVEPLPGDRVVEKHHANGFRETRLLEELRGGQIERLVICGAMSHMCVDATVRAAADLGFSCVVIQDACATRDLQFQGRTIAAGDVHGAFMAALGAGYAAVRSVDEFLDAEKAAS